MMVNEYLNGNGLDDDNDILGENERVVFPAPEITSGAADDTINERGTVKLQRIVDNLGTFPVINMQKQPGILFHFITL